MFIELVIYITNINKRLLFVYFFTSKIDAFVIYFIIAIEKKIKCI